MLEAIAQHRLFTPAMRSRFAAVLADRVTATWAEPVRESQPPPRPDGQPSFGQ
jgi:hypothetical protein